MGYTPRKDQCFFRTCVRKAKHPITYAGREVKVCDGHKIYDGVHFDRTGRPYKK